MTEKEKRFNVLYRVVSGNLGFQPQKTLLEKYIDNNGNPLEKCPHWANPAVDRRVAQNN